jgi:hypothetical protein
VKYDDIVAKAPEYGLDVKEATENLAGFRRGESDSCRRCCRSGIGDGAWHICLNAEVGEVDGQAVSPPPVLPFHQVICRSLLCWTSFLIWRRGWPLRCVLHSICTRQKELRNALQNIPTLRKRLADSRGDVTAGVRLALGAHWNPVSEASPFACGLARAFSWLFVCGV